MRSVLFSPTAQVPEDSALDDDVDDVDDAEAADNPTAMLGFGGGAKHGMGSRKLTEAAAPAWLVV